MAYFEVEFQSPVDLVRVSLDMKQRLFVDEFVNALQSKYWFAQVSEHGLAVVNCCLVSPEEMGVVLNNTRAAGEQVPEPIRGSFAEVK